MGPTWGPPGSCRPHFGPMNLAISVVLRSTIMLFNFSVCKVDINQIHVLCPSDYVSNFSCLAGFYDDGTITKLILWQTTIICTNKLTHRGRVTHICVSKLTIIGPDYGLSPGLRKANIWTNAGMLLITPPGTNFTEISIEILTFQSKNLFKSVFTIIQHE